MADNELLVRLFDTLREHLSAGAAWVPWLVVGVTALVGLALMVRGARLAPWFVTLALLVGGGYAGVHLGPQIGTSEWLGGAGAGIIGLLLAVFLFRFWMAVQVAGLLVGGALLLYGGQVLQPALNSYLSKGLDPAAPAPIKLQDPNAGVVDQAGGLAVLGDLWGHLSAEVPSFQVSFVAIVVSTAIAGLVFSVLLPRVARSFWAATVGTLLLLLAVWVVVRTHWPDALPWLLDHGALIGGGLWGIALVANLADMLGWRRRRPPARSEDAPAAEPA